MPCIHDVPMMVHCVACALLAKEREANPKAFDRAAAERWAEEYPGWFRMLKCPCCEKPVMITADGRLPEKIGIVDMNDDEKEDHEAG